MRDNMTAPGSIDYKLFVEVQATLSVVRELENRLHNIRLPKAVLWIKIQTLTTGREELRLQLEECESYFPPHLTGLKSKRSKALRLGDRLNRSTAVARVSQDKKLAALRESEANRALRIVNVLSAEINHYTAQINSVAAELHLVETELRQARAKYEHYCQQELEEQRLYGQAVAHLDEISSWCEPTSVAVRLKAC